ncbi:polysaccharide pyruvyl transferase family protein [Mesorhizobium sp. SB112]|uniref:polysaccharide pyruvyl transferase family protein n=1 Tax=Mesorhizobium sp. SB112 TaxID=3151853 RepID=UPI003265A151
MKPFYWESEHGNFGDDLNLWLWDFLLPGFREVHPELLLVGVGTVLNKALLPETGKKLVIGSGFGYGSLPDMSDRSEWDIRCVRGPLTAEKVGLPQELGIIDPAVMVADMPEFQNLPKLHDAIFIPHWESTVGGIWPIVCKAAGLTYVDPCGEAKSVINAIAQSRLVIAESMHAAILADAFRVPWVAVSTSRSINSFKWSDWASTVHVAYKPQHVPVSSRAEAITKGARFWGVQFQGKQAVSEDPNKSGFDKSLVMTQQDPHQSPLRVLAKQVLAAPSTLALRSARKSKPQLSADSVLEAQKQKFRDVLAEIRRDYL